jgi:hypothetical protein
MVEVLHQKGANGLVAEYECAVALCDGLASAGFQCVTDRVQLEFDRDSAIERVANELSAAQIARAGNQGRALAGHIVEGVVRDTARLGLPDLSSSSLKSAQVAVELVGHQTNSGSSADLLIDFVWTERKIEIPISLKAYGERPASLGSKGARASLARAFMGDAKVSDQDFQEYFGEPARIFMATLADFKAAASEFYASSEGTAFVKAYQERKRLASTAKVNNPLRRKEVGDYFARTRGFVSEHRFAELYSQMWLLGMDRVDSGGEPAWGRFLEGFRFLIGMDEDILTLNAVAEDSTGTVLRVENSFMSDTYTDIRRALVNGCSVELLGRPRSSTLKVRLIAGQHKVDALTLAVWKDATIQFKLNHRRAA